MIVRGRELHLHPRRGGVAAHARRRPVAVGGPRRGIVHGRKGHAARAHDRRAHDDHATRARRCSTLDGRAASRRVGLHRCGIGQDAPAAATAATTGTVDVGAGLADLRLIGTWYHHGFQVVW